jgi:carbamoyl-phosphate synthase large subunit
LKKALAAAHFLPLEKGKILVSLAAKDRKEALPLLKEAKMMGFALASTLSTADFLLEEGLKGERITEEEALAFIEKGEYVLVVNTPTQGKDFNHFGFILRRRALENGICLFTSLDTFKAFLEAYPAEEGEPLALEDYLLWREKLIC